MVEIFNNHLFANLKSPVPFCDVLQDGTFFIGVSTIEPEEQSQVAAAMRLVTNIKTNKDVGHKNRTPCSLKMVQVIFLPLLYCG